MQLIVSWQIIDVNIYISLKEKNMKFCFLRYEICVFTPQPVEQYI